MNGVRKVRNICCNEWEKYVLVFVSIYCGCEAVPCAKSLLRKRQITKWLFLVYLNIIDVATWLLNSIFLNFD